MKWLRWLLPAAILTLGPGMVAAQQPTTITGRVTDATGSPLAAASVYIPTLNLGTLSNAQGRYVLVVPAARALGQQVALTASQLGHRTATAPVTLSPGSITHDFQLADDPLRLEEVVVTGEGTTTVRSKLSSAIATVKSADLQKSMEPNVVEALAGKAPGVVVTSSSGDPGAGSYINIRGAASITSGTQPLFVVDGTPIDNSSHNTDPGGDVAGTAVTNRGADINPADIDHVEILKGAAATAIYGSQAANGVVLITTKSGRPGSTRATLSTTYGRDDVTRTVPLQTEYGQGSGGKASTTSSGSWGPKLPPGTAIFDHANEIYRPANRWDTNLELSGGSENTTYYLSVGRLDQQGDIVGPQDYVKNNVRLKASHFFLDNLNVHGNIAYTASSGDFVQQGSNISGIQLGALRTPPNYNNLPYFDPATGFPLTYRRQKPTSLTQSHGYDNPFWVAYREPSTSKVGRTMGNVGADYNPMPWLKVSYLFGADYSGDDRLTLFPKGSDSFLQGAIARGSLITQMWESDLSATATGQLARGITGSLTLGQSLNQRNFNQNLTNGTTLLNGTTETNFAVTNVGSEFKSTVRTDGYFGTGEVSFGNQLSLNGTLRRDGSSTFGGQNTFWYPGFGGAWTFTNNSVVKSIPVLNLFSYGKLRASFGESGRQPPVFSNVSSFTTGSFIDGWVSNGLYSLYDGHEGVFTQGTLGNDHIKPERVKEYEVGTDLAVLNQRVQLGVTYYNRKTTDAIMAVPIPPSSGFSNEFANAATFNNHGVEASLDVNAIQSKSFEWTLNGQWSMNRSCVTSIAGADNLFFNGFNDPYAAVVAPDKTTKQCHPFGVIFGSDFVRYGRGVLDQNTGTPIDDKAAPAGTIYVGADGFPQLDPQFRVLGDPNPQWIGSIRSTFRFFNNLAISGLVDIQHGGIRWNGTRGALSFFGAARWTTPYHGAGVTETYAKFCGCKVAGPGVGQQVSFDQDWFQSNIGSGFTGPSAQFIENGGFVKLRDVSLSYTFGGRTIERMGMSSMDLTLSGRNLLTSTTYTGIDPESNLTGQSTGRGLDYFNNPQTRSLLVTLTLHR